MRLISFLPLGVTPCSALILLPSIDLAGKPGTGSTMADYRKEYVPASAVRTDAGPSRPAAGPEAASVTRGEGVSSLFPHVQRHPPLPLANATFVCAAAVTCMATLHYRETSCLAECDLVKETSCLLLAVNRSRIVIGQV